MQKIKKSLKIFYGLLTLGYSLRDKFTLLRLYLHYPLRNRGLYTYSNKTVCFKIKFRNKISSVFLRDNGTDMIIFQAIFIFGEYQPPFSLSQSPRIIYDLGCNIGLFGVWINSLYPESTVIGFEPVPNNYDIAVLNYKNVNGKVMPIAVGCEEGVVSMILDKENTGAHRLSKLGILPESKVLCEIEVKIDTLSNMINQHSIPQPDFLKIDAEGSELDILTGLSEFIENVKYIVVEPDQDKESICTRFLQEKGFKIMKKKLIWAFK